MTSLYPRSAISIFVEVLQADGGDYAVCVNAATLALIDAGIPIRDVCCAVSCGLAIKDSTTYTLLDLGNQISNKIFVVNFLFNTGFFTTFSNEELHIHLGGSGILYKSLAPKLILSNDELHMILKRTNLEI